LTANRRRWSSLSKMRSVDHMGVTHLLRLPIP
jgi:hypothetical protein